MKVAVLSESPPDEAAIAILVEAALDASVERVAGPPLRSRGWPSVRSILPVVIKHLHFRTDADGLVCSSRNGNRDHVPGRLPPL